MQMQLVLLRSWDGGSSEGVNLMILIHHWVITKYANKVAHIIHEKSSFHMCVCVCIAENSLFKKDK